MRYLITIVTTDLPEMEWWFDPEQAATTRDSIHNFIEIESVEIKECTW